MAEQERTRSRVKKKKQWLTRNRLERDTKRETEMRETECICLPRMNVQQRCPGNAAAWIMSWLVALLLETSSQPSCLHSTGCERATWDTVWWTAVHTHTHKHTCAHTELSFIHIHSMNSLLTPGWPLYSQYHFTSTSQSFARCWTRCVWCGKVQILALIFACSSAHIPFSTSTLSAITVNQSRSGYLQLSPHSHPPPLAPACQPSLHVRYQHLHHLPRPTSSLHHHSHIMLAHVNPRTIIIRTAVQDLHVPPASLWPHPLIPFFFFF